MVNIQNVRKVYKVGEERVVALNDISLQIHPGEICCFLGTSGSGKSTLLNIMAGLEKPTKGTIAIQGKQIEKMNEKEITKFRQKHIGFIFQSYNLLPSLTALENVSLPLTFRGIPKNLRDRMAMEILEAVGLKKHIAHKPSQMSGGQQQRVGIARAFVSKPPIIFADEPTGNLDSRTTGEIMSLMLDMARDYKQTLVLVTHDRTIAEFADRIVYILDGNIEKVEEKNFIKAEEQE
jgi:putative ABC transport system ATP-binding protein